MTRMTALGVVLLALSGAGDAAAQSDGRQTSAVEWLAREPVTLLDWGMMRLERDFNRSVDDLTATYLHTPILKSGVYHRFADQRIVAYVTIVDAPVNRTGDACIDVFTRLAGRLTAGAPQGPGGASWYLESVFSPDIRRANRPQDLGDQLLDRVVMQVSIGPRPEEAFYGDPRKVTCRGRLNATASDIDVVLRSEG